MDNERAVARSGCADIVDSVRTVARPAVRSALEKAGFLRNYRGAGLPMIESDIESGLDYRSLNLNFWLRVICTMRVL